MILEIYAALNLCRSGCLDLKELERRKGICAARLISITRSFWCKGRNFIHPFYVLELFSPLDQLRLTKHMLVLWVMLEYIGFLVSV